MIQYEWNALPLWLQDGIVAAIIGWLLSGIPSTLYALFTGGDIYEATLAAGSILIGEHASFTFLIISAVVVHTGLSFFWAITLTLLLPKNNIIIWAFLGGFGIAILDLLIIGQFFPMIKALPFLPQLIDHLAFGAIVGTVLFLRHKKRKQKIKATTPSIIGRT